MAEILERVGKNEPNEFGEKWVRTSRLTSIIIMITDKRIVRV